MVVWGTEVVCVYKGSQVQSPILLINVRRSLELTEVLSARRRGPERKTILFPTKMKLLLLLLCLGLTIVCIQAEEYSSMGRNFNVEQISGYWFSIAEASDEREKIEEHGSMRHKARRLTCADGRDGV